MAEGMQSGPENTGSGDHIYAKLVAELEASRVPGGSPEPETSDEAKTEEPSADEPKLSPEAEALASKMYPGTGSAESVPATDAPETASPTEPTSAERVGSARDAIAKLSVSHDERQLIDQELAAAEATADARIAAAQEAVEKAQNRKPRGEAGKATKQAALETAQAELQAANEAKAAAVEQAALNVREALKAVQDNQDASSNIVTDKEQAHLMADAAERLMAQSEKLGEDAAPIFKEKFKEQAMEQANKVGEQYQADREAERQEAERRKAAQEQLIADQKAASDKLMADRATEFAKISANIHELRDQSSQTSVLLKADTPQARQNEEHKLSLLYETLGVNPADFVTTTISGSRKEGNEVVDIYRELQPKDHERGSLPIVLVERRSLATNELIRLDAVSLAELDRGFTTDKRGRIQPSKRLEEVLVFQRNYKKVETPINTEGFIRRRTKTNDDRLDDALFASGIPKGLGGEPGLPPKRRLRREGVRGLFARIFNR